MTGPGWSAPVPGAVPLLAGLDPASAPSHPLIIAAAIRHSRTLPDPHNRLAWARFAHTTSYRQHGPFRPVSRRAALAYALALTEHGRVIDAYRIHQHRLIVARLIGDSDELIVAHRHLAEARHAISQCEQAAADIHHALILWHAHHQPAGENHQILASYAAILTGCGQPHAAIRLLRTHPDLLPATAADQEALAARIVAAQDTHPAVCRRHPTRRPPQTATAQRLAEWQDVLRQLKPQPATRPHNPTRPGRDHGHA